MKSTWGSSIQRIAFAASILLAACGDSEDGTSDTSEPDVPAGPAELQLDATSKDFGSVLVGDSSARATFIVTNIGGSPSGAIALTLGGDDRASFTVAGNTCRGGLAPMGSCTITVLFMPRAAGAQSATLGVAADKGNIVSVALEGEGTAPGALSIASDIGDLGSVTVGATSATRATFTVTNGGGADTGPLTVQATGAHPSDFTRSDDACQDEVLAPGATCTFVVTFTPRTSGPKSASFQVSAYPGGRVSGAVSGIGASLARLVALPVSQPFGSVVVGADSAPLTIRVANAGGSASGPIAVTAAGDDGAMFSASGACVGETLAPGAACDLAVVFTPTSLGPKRGQIEIGASPGGTAVTTVTGSGIGPQLVIAPTLTAFAPLALDAVSAPRAFTVTNRGDRDSGPITTTLAGIDPGEFQIGDDTCDGVALPPNGRCTLVVLYSPGTAGPASAELVVASVQSGTATAGLSGAGLPPAALVIAPEDRGFGAIAVGRDTAALSFTLTNRGGERSGLLTIALGGADADQFRIVAESCPARLGPGKTCEVRVRFRPSAIGEAAAALTVSGDPGGTATAALSGEGVDPDQLVVTPPTFTFPPTAVGASASQTFTVDNDSAAATGTLVVDTSGPHARDFTFTRDCTALAPHATCTVNVTFTPSAPSLRSAALNVGGNPGGRVSSALAGVAVPGLEIVDAAGMAAATRFDFGDVIVATTLDHEADVIVRNNTTADATLTLSTRFGEPAQYTLVSNTCDATDIIAAGATCTVRVRFRPTSLGLKSGKVTFAIGSGPYDRAIWDLVGRGVDALRIVPETTSQFGEVPRNTRSAPLTFRVDNPLGAQPSGPLAASLGGAGYRIEDDGCAGLTLAAGASCTITVTFAPLGNGFSPGTLRVTGNPGGTATQALAATAVDPVGARPSAVALTPASVAENLPIGTVVGTLTTTDADAGDTFAYTLVNGSGSSGNARFELTGNTIATRVVFDHEATPTQTIRVRVVDSGGQVFDQVLTIVVANVDEPAVTTPDAATVREDAAATLVDVLVNDLDPDGDVLLASASQPGHGAVVVAAGKTSLTYRPAADYCNTPPGSALDTFTYTLEGSGAVGTVQVAVTCVDDPGVAVDDEAEVTQGDDATEIDVLANDRDIDSALLIDSVSQPSEGEVEIVDGGAALTYEPAPNPTETEIEFSYELVGGGTAIVRVEVTILDDAPTTDDDTATVAEDAAATAIDVLANDDDTDGGPMLIRSVVQPANGTVVLTGPSNARTGLTYAPDPDYCNDPPGTALDTFTYTLNGGAVGTVTVTVTCSDDAPTADDDTATLAEDASATAIDVLGNDDDVDGGTITIAAIGSAPSHGTVVLTGGSLGAHTGLTYEPADDYCNTPPGTALDTFTYQINGGAVGTVTVAVTCADDAPTADDDTATVAEDATATAIDVLANDDDVDGGTKVIASIVQAPTHGAVVLTGGTAGAHTGLTYEPNDNYCNTPPGTALDTFTYALNGGDTATVAVTVTCVDDQPVAGPTDTASVAEDAAATAIDVLANDGDGGDGGAKVIASISQAPQNGNVVLTGGSAGAHTGLTYEPNDDYCNTPPGTALDTFKYLLNGGSEGTVAVTVNCVDDPPVAVTDVATVLEDAAAASAIDVLANDTDVDGGAKTIASNGAATLGTVTLTGGTSGAHTGLTYKASADACGADTFTYTLNGGSSATVGVTVTCVNDAPSFTAGPDVTRANSTSGGLAITHTVDPWAADIAAGPGNELGQALDFIVSNDNNGLFTIQPAVSSTGVLTFTTNPAVEGSALVTIALHDNGGTANEGDDTSASQTFTITTVNQTAPIITSADNTAFKVGTEGIFIVTADGVPGGGDITLSSSGTLPSGVTFIDNDDGTATLIGTPAAGTAGTYALTITADNGIDPDATQSFTLTVNQSPAITSADSDTFLVLVEDAFTVTTTGFPTNASMAITTNSALPSGVTLTNNNDGTATLGGTPAAGSGGSYAITIIADNGVSPPASQGFTLIVNQPPAITSANATTFITQTAGSFEVTTTGFPTNASMTISRSGALPSGVTFTNNGNGKATLAGTPAAGTGGTYPITITANNGVSPEATQSFTLTVQQPPAITSANSVTFAPGKTGQTFVVTTTGFPTNGAMAITTGTLPSGLALTNNNDGTATLAGTPAAGTAGTYPLTLTADNGVSPNATQSFTLNITCPTIAVSGTIPTLRFDSAMTAAQFSQTGGNGTIAWSATTLPGGTSIDGSSGAVTGTPTHTGTFAAVITATDAGGCIGTKGQGVAVAPDPVDDTYATGLVDNTQLVITGGTTASPTTPFVAATGKLITNDKPSGGVTLTAGTFATSAGGSVTIAADGTFVYTPELNSGAAANTSDTFDYTISSDTAGTGTPVSDTGTATLTLVGRIWYVRNNSTAGGNGQSHAPFDTLAEAGTASTAGDTIFVYAGDDTSTGHGAIALKANQTLWGQGVAFTQGGVSIAVGNLPLLAGTVSLADGVRVNSVRIASGGAIAIDGGTSNTVTFSDVTVSGGTTGLRFTGGNGTVVWTRGSIGDVTSRHVDIQDRSGGSVSFDCGIGGAGTGIFLDGNANTTFSFTGGVLLSTGSNTAFTATNGGTVTVIGAGNTLTTTTGTALNVVDTNIGSGGLIFQRISAGTASTSTGPGISLRRTGSVGGLTVTGTGTPGSGGTIRNKSAGDQAVNGSGIYLFETANVSLSWMQLNDFSNFAILGLAVHNLTLHRVVVNGTNGDNGGYDEASVAFGNSMFTGITGTATITDSTFSNSASSAEDTFRLRQATGSLDRITITNSTFSCANPRGDALNFESSGSATLNVTVQDSFITAAAGDQFQFNPGSTAANDLIFARNTLSNNNAAIATGGGGVSILANGNGTFTFDLDDNTFRDAVGPAVLLVKSTGAATFSGFFRNNEIGVAGTANSGSAEGSGLKIQNAGLGTVTVAVTDNVITQYNNYGIELMTGGGASALGGTLNATVTGNVITDPGNTPGALGIAKNGIHVNAGTVPGDTYLLALDIGGAGALANSVANAGAPNDSGAGGEDIRIRHRMDTVVQLRGYTGAANADAAVQTYILARNAIGSPSAIASNNQSTGSDGFFNTPGPGNAVPQP